MANGHVLLKVIFVIFIEDPFSFEIIEHQVSDSLKLAFLKVAVV